jgi:hypothetical protein
MKLSALIYNMCCKMSLESIWIRMHMVKICTKYFEWMWHAIYIFEHVSGTHRDLLIIIGLQMWLSSVYKINSNSPWHTSIQNLPKTLIYRCFKETFEFEKNI